MTSLKPSKKAFTGVACSTGISINAIPKKTAKKKKWFMKDMGKVMGIVSKQLAGQADGKTISVLVRKNLA